MTFKGDNSIFGVKVEAAFAETPSQGAQTICLGITPNIDFSDEPEFKDYHSVNSNRDMITEAQGKINVTGTIPVEVQNGRIIYYGMGSHSVTGTNPYTHTVTGGATLPSLCLEGQYTGTNRFLRYYIGTKVNTLDLEAVEGGEVKSSISFISAKGYKSTNTVSTVTQTTTTPFMYHKGAVTIDSYASYAVTTFKWSVNNNLKPIHTIRQTNGQYAQVVVEGKREYEITAEIVIQDVATYNTAIYDLLIAGTTFTTTIDVRRSANDSMVMTASNCTMRGAPHNIPEPGEEVRVSVTIKPRSCSWTIVDAIASYA